jgi:hypothetical protein
MLETNYVDRDELVSCLDTFTSKQSIKFYDISKEEYDRVINSKRNARVKIGRKSPAYEDES